MSPVLWHEGPNDGLSIQASPSSNYTLQYIGGYVQFTMQCGIVGECLQRFCNMSAPHWQLSPLPRHHASMSSGPCHYHTFTVLACHRHVSGIIPLLCWYTISIIRNMLPTGVSLCTLLVAPFGVTLHISSSSHTCHYTGCIITDIASSEIPHPRLQAGP